MASKLRANIPESTFRWEVPKFSDECRKLSPEFDLRGFPWKLELRKIRTIQENTLKIYLQRTNQTKDVELTCMAFVEIKLLSFDENVPPLRKVLNAMEYGAGNASMMGLNLASLEELNDPSKKYIHNDKIVLEIHIKVDPPQKVFQNDLARLQIIWNVRSAIKLNLTIKDLDKMVGIISPIFSLCKIPWYICVYRNDNTVDIALRPVRKDLINRVYNVTLTIKLLSFNQLLYIDYERVFSGKIDGNDTAFVFKDFIQWNELVNSINHFIRDGSIKFDIVIQINEANEQASQSIPSSQHLNESSICCPICFDCLLDLSAVSLKCGHIFCQECVNSSIRSKKQCPTCRAKVLPSHIRPIFLTFAP